MRGIRMRLVKLEQMKRKTEKTGGVSDDLINTVRINKKEACLKIDDECLNELYRKTLIGKLRCESDQHASLEYAGSYYSR